MPIGKLFDELKQKYGNDLNWTQSGGDSFANELRKEITPSHPLYKYVTDYNTAAAAKCDSNDDVLFRFYSNGREDIYIIVHLTYSAHNTDGFPRYIELSSTDKIKEYIESSVKNYL